MKAYLLYTTTSLLFFLLASFTVFASAPFIPRQKIFYLTNGCASAEIPFRLVQNLIIIPAMLDGKKELNLIVDSGTSSALIFNRRYLKGLDIPYGRRVTFQGVGKGSAVSGQVISNIALHLSGAATDRIGMVVLDTNPFQNMRLEGVLIHGVLGSTLFKSFVVEIDFQLEILRLYEHETFIPKAGYTMLPMKIHSEKPIIRASVMTDQVSADIDVNLMVDTGFNNRLLLYTGKSSPVHLPANVRTRQLGLGYSGRVASKVGYVQQLSLGVHVMDQVYTIFPEKGSYQLGMNEEIVGRHGTLGTGTLKHFKIIFNYPGETFYLKAQEEQPTVIAEWEGISE